MTCETNKEELKMDLTSINFSEFKNKKILITGGSTGIGAELTKAFAKQGAIVGLHYLSSENAANKVQLKLRILNSCQFTPFFEYSEQSSIETKYSEQLSVHSVLRMQRTKFN